MIKDLHVLIKIIFQFFYKIYDVKVQHTLSMYEMYVVYVCMYVMYCTF